MKTTLTICMLIFCKCYLSFSQSNEIGSGLSLKFSTNNYIDIGNVFDDLNFPFTFETWINPSIFPASRSGIFSTDNDFSTYAGWYVRVTNAGKIEIEFGNGFGSGTQHRRGFVSSNAIKLNKWTHITIVCNSITDINFYFNGVLQNIVPTDGFSSSTEIYHSAASGSIGKYANVFASQYFEGQLDEIRLWNIARAENKIRNFMCQKADISEPNLVAYWKGDESNSSSTVNDYTVPSENGNIIGNVLKINSGAPIGDKSNYEYTTNWSDKKIVVNTPAGDQFMVKNISGMPAGVHVYFIDSAPYSTNGLNIAAEYYFGAFSAETTGSNATYKVRYSYSTSNGLVNADNESFVDLAGRFDNSVSSWLDINASLNISDNIITRFNQAYRGEYILNIEDEGKMIESNAAIVNSVNKVIAFPNPSANMINFTLSKTISGPITYSIYNLSGQLVQKLEQVSPNEIASYNVSNLTAGYYFIEGISLEEIFSGTFGVHK